MTDDIKSAVSDVMTAFEEFKKANDDRLKQIETRGAADAVTEAKLQKIESALASVEGVNARVVAAELEAKAAKDEAAELKGRLDEAELKAQRPRPATDPDQVKRRANGWARAVIDAQTKGVVNLTGDQRQVLAEVAAEYKALSVGDDTTGGYLAPPDYVREIIKGVTEASPVRSLVRVRATAGKSLQLPTRTGQFAAVRVAEQGARAETDGLRFGLAEIAAPEMVAIIDVSEQNLEDSAFDLETEITFEATEQFAVKEGQEFVSGTGNGQCEGILVNADVDETISGTATAVTADGLLNLKHGVKSAYARNATWVLNRTVLGSIRRLKDAQGNYLWQPGLAQGRPNTLDGDPYVECPDMPVEGAGTYPVAYGDFRRAYVLLDRIAMKLLRDPYTQASSGNIRFHFRRRVGGAVVLPEAIRKLKCAA